MKSAEAQTGAGTATVCRAIAERVNEGAVDGDKVSGEALRQRAVQNAGEKKRICSIGTNKPEPKPKEREMTVEEEARQRGLRLGSQQAMYFAKITIE